MRSTILGLLLAASCHPPHHDFRIYGVPVHLYNVHQLPTQQELQTATDWWVIKMAEYTLRKPGQMRGIFRYLERIVARDRDDPPRYELGPAHGVYRPRVRALEFIEYGNCVTWSVYFHELMHLYLDATHQDVDGGHKRREAWHMSRRIFQEFTRAVDCSERVADE